MNWFPLIVLLGLSTLGLGLKSIRSPRFLRWQPRLYVINAFAVGVAGVWILAAWIRGLFIIPLGPSWNLFDLVLAPAVLFPIEGWLLLGATALELFYLKGNYKVSNEWKKTVFNGLKSAGLLIGTSTLLTVLFWWMIRPGEYGRFEDSIVQRLVTQRAGRIFEPIAGETRISPESMASIQNAKSIPHAIVMASLLASLIPFAKPTIRYFRKVMTDDYVHLPPKPKKGEKQQEVLPVARGGGPN